VDSARRGRGFGKGGGGEKGSCLDVEELVLGVGKASCRGGKTRRLKGGKNFELLGARHRKDEKGIR